MYNPYDPDEVFQTTPKRSLEDTLKDTAYSFLSNTLLYAVPVAAGLVIGNGLTSVHKAATLGMVSALCSGYVQSLNYRNDFYERVGDCELGDGLKNELRLREAIGALRGFVEGSALLLSGTYAAAYIGQAVNLAK
ncbi:MAG: hypothetical protein A2912_05870 [Candidatus Buchananbacteria bacterium RIFCSPLOWO2_01_FULL_40_23b]|uniref:Uncharacterized protein n=1 Tax=Candidatus Buchananbacteria bacterium RIFCSPLOWO2_01_FULL_40_23b TaxID=1797544 RepID=A0A1G1YT28_9BACT|nr:MAG: hypothetical protein A2912_05870 [Candidatus Buchananbacteria bacterium RIFCSPLOWO2_01_FULL_40_23b]